MRLFVALDVADDIRARIQGFVEGVSGFAPEARWVRPDSLHLTLKFIGEKPDDFMEKIKLALLAVKSEPLQFTFRAYGFFPSPRRPRIFWIGVDSDPHLGSLAAAVDEALVPLGIPKETHGFSPHITLARAAASHTVRRPDADDPNGGFGRLQKKLAVLSAPEFGSMTAREFFLYESRLNERRPSSGGSHYMKLARFELV
jgi:2'-5' RNA ligase